ncbi:kinase-like domain-containing protein [Suillus subalutaceus]|uniref:kinase-like domain-containing protein n=1 Tax=Suillus subalutaceus TaxID=48586 RepID=UPI001B86A442|nr:kinase-like domain-containing protein [Suillus subalutaceus]KAG1859315.1 kinase-like domain-containing protein [Suillus subalutaceus]
MHILYFCEICEDAPSPINLLFVQVTAPTQCRNRLRSIQHLLTASSLPHANYWKRLRINCSLSISSFTGEGTTSSNSDELKRVPDLTTSSTGPESPCIVSPSGSLASFVVVASPAVGHEDPDCERDLPSSLTQPYLKIDVDLQKYHPQPQDLTHYIIRTENYPLSLGGFSDVWKCKLDSFPRNGIKMPPEDVAVKVLRVLSRNPKDMKQLIKKLRQEVFLWQQLKTLTYTAFQYLKIMWDEQFSPEMHRLFRLLSQVVLGLQYLHFSNIIHGDLMPFNVLIDENENALLADFGLSRLLGDHETSFFDSHGPGAIRWAAPEITPLDPEKPDEEISKPNKPSDIYSFGCIMMQVLSGQSPYFDISETCIPVAKFKGTPPTRPPGIADVHWCYIERCLSLDVDTRPLVDEVLEYIKAECDRQKLASRAGRSRQ